MDCPKGYRLAVTAGFASLLLVVALAGTDVRFSLTPNAAAKPTRPYLRIEHAPVEAPVAWLIACALLWIFFFPMYLVSRSRLSRTPMPPTELRQASVGAHSHASISAVLA